MSSERNSTDEWGQSTDQCLGCGLYDFLYKGYCKPCFDIRGMEYDKDYLEHNAKEMGRILKEANASVIYLDEPKEEEKKDD